MHRCCAAKPTACNTCLERAGNDLNQPFRGYPYSQGPYASRRSEESHRALLESVARPLGIHEEQKTALPSCSHSTLVRPGLELLLPSGSGPLPSSQCLAPREHPTQRSDRYTHLVVHLHNRLFHRSEESRVGKEC